MKVLYLLDSLNRGGVEVLALDVCRNARAHDLDLTFVATGGGLLEADFKTSGVEFIRLNRRLPLDFKVVRELRKIIESRGIQIVHAQQAVEGLHAYFARLGTAAKLVLSFQGFVPDAKNRLALKFLIPRAAANVVVSRELLNWLKQQNLNIERNLHIIYNGVDEKRLGFAGKNLKQELNLPANALLLGMTANFYADPRKDQLTVCLALPQFFAENPNAHFAFIGGAEENSSYAECVRFCREHKIENRTSFLGVRDDVADILHSLDIFVLSSLHEGLPVAVIEAMLVGKPCVLSDIPPLLEISAGGSFAEIFQTGNAAQLTEKLNLLAKNADLREKLAARARTSALQNLSAEAHLTNLKKLYETLV